MNRDEAIRRIRAGLKKRSGKTWSVTGGRGTGWGWIRIMSPPARRDGYSMSAEDRAELGRLLGMAGPAHGQGEQVPASTAYYTRYVELAETGSSTVEARPYWD